jgi:hypothetical protein
VQGLAESKGQRQRIRINSVLNSMGMSGPGLANSLGCIALMCSFFESVAYNVRGTDDILNPAGAAALNPTTPQPIRAAPKKTSQALALI